MNVVLSPKAAKYLKRLNQPIKGRIIEALEDLAKEPPEGDIRAMAGRDGYRLRIGGYRALFDIMENEIVVYEIGPRGQIYKGRR